LLSDIYGGVYRRPWSEMHFDKASTSRLQ
jgi:hypothetical protein